MDGWSDLLSPQLGAVLHTLLTGISQARPLNRAGIVTNQQHSLTLDAGAPDISALPEQPLRPEEARIARQAFLAAFSERGEFGDDDTLASLMLQLDAAAKPLMDRARASRSIDNALSKMHGDWFEWILCWVAEDVEHISHCPYSAIRLPNKSQFDVVTLYQSDLSKMLEQLRAEVRRAGVELITSNPDFAIVRKRFPTAARPVINAESIERWMNLYRNYTEVCGFGEIRGFVAAKYSLRPDRLLQIPHEGSLMKALYVHLQTRLWVTDPPELLFYAVAQHVGKANRKNLRTVATHSITSVASRPQAAVDHVFETKTIRDARRMFNEILRSSDDTV